MSSILAIVVLFLYLPNLSVFDITAYSFKSTPELILSYSSKNYISSYRYQVEFPRLRKFIAGYGCFFRTTSLYVEGN